MIITFYKLHHATDNTKESYVGSTGDYVRRQFEHKSKCNNTNCKAYKFKVYSYIREHGGYNAWLHTVLQQEYYPDTIINRNENAVARRLKRFILKKNHADDPPSRKTTRET